MPIYQALLILLTIFLGGLFYKEFSTLSVGSVRRPTRRGALCESEQCSSRYQLRITLGWECHPSLFESEEELVNLGPTLPRGILFRPW